MLRKRVKREVEKKNAFAKCRERKMGENNGWNDLPGYHRGAIVYSLPPPTILFPTV